jgi:putative ATP-dependent endonuclease of OLD family
MYITELKIKNFRLLKDVEINLNQDKSYIIGKNNSGKTSILSILNNFINSDKRENAFKFYDFNIDIQKSILESLLSTKTKETNFINNSKISLTLDINYDTNDNWSDLKDFMVDLDDDNNYITLKCEYMITDKKYYDNLLKEIEKIKDKDKDKIKAFLIKNINTYWNIKVSSIYKDTEKVLDEKLKDIINFNYINAKREVRNNESTNTKTYSLSYLINKYYETTKDNLNPEIIQTIEQSVQELNNTLNTQYKDGIFSDLLKNIQTMTESTFVQMSPEIKSSFDYQNIIKEKNKDFLYTDNGNENSQHNISLPEDYNGLGVLNFIFIVIELHRLTEEIKNNNDKNKKVNLLFIEEPEAHTHPQMQYIFADKINDLIKDYQTIITTHSSHIVSRIKFEDIRYLCKKDNTVSMKMLEKFSTIYNTNDKKNKDDSFYFLKQYLTLNVSELFFAEKAILFEGDTERILLPLFMKHVNDRLLQQNISLIQINGRHMHVFAKFLEFIGTKNLIITDWDYQEEKKDKDGTITQEEKKEITTNPTIRDFYEKNVPHPFNYEPLNEYLMITTQTKSEDDNENYQAYSFEDAFLSIEKNYNLIKNNKDNCVGLKNRKEIDDYKNDINFKDRADEIIDRKPVFATDIFILITREENKNTWETPKYIKKGLEWLAKN